MTQQEWIVIGDGFKTTSSKTAVLFPCLERVMGDLTGKSVLDVGCGDGFGVRWLREKGAMSVGCDISPGAVASCRARDPEGRYEVMDAKQIDLAETFDFVLSLLVLISFDSEAQIIAAIRSMAAKLKPGGRLVIAVTHPCFEHLNANMETMTREVAADYAYGKKAAPIVYRNKADDLSFTDFHWRIEDYVECLRAADLVIEQLSEPAPVIESRAVHPDLYEARSAYPPFLVIVAAPKAARG